MSTKRDQQAAAWITATEQRERAEAAEKREARLKKIGGKEMGEIKTDIAAATAAPRSVGELLDRLEDRSIGQRQWLLDNYPECFEEQKHTDDGTPERAYWHYGYMVALRDVAAALRRLPASATSDTPSPSRGDSENG
jgi:hypothetical protein